VLLVFTPGSCRYDLTDSERTVAIDLLAGLSNATIARRRGVALRTIANQVAAVLRKVGVASRAELAARCNVTELI
jgi:DNA-binding NarL/FixJ family response regulator